MHRISVIVPHFNRPEQVATALGSVQAQQGIDRLFELEILVVDDGSSPPLAEFESTKIRLIRLEQNQGAAAARNAGIAAATGDMIAFLDSDDRWVPDKLRLQLEFAEQHDVSGIATYTTGYLTRRRSRNIETYCIPADVLTLQDFVAGLRTCPGSTALVPRHVVDRIGPFDTALRRLEDVDWHVRHGLAGGQVHVVPQVCVRIDTHGSVDVDQVREARNHLWEKYSTAFPERRTEHRFRAYLDLNLCEAEFLNGNWPGTAYRLATSLWHAPRTRLQLLTDAELY